MRLKVILKKLSLSPFFYAFFCTTSSGNDVEALCCPFTTIGFVAGIVTTIVVALKERRERKERKQKIGDFAYRKEREEEPIHLEKIRFWGIKWRLENQKARIDKKIEKLHKIKDELGELKFMARMEKLNELKIGINKKLEEAKAKSDKRIKYLRDNADKILQRLEGRINKEKEEMQKYKEKEKLQKSQDMLNSQETVLGQADNPPCE